MKMEYFGIRVTNLEKSVKFYTSVLGLTEVRRGDMTKHNRGIWVLLKDERTGQQLELNWYPPNSQFCTHYEVGDGVDHIGFLVNDVKKTFEDLLRKGAEPTEVTPEKTEGLQAYVTDPDGIWIELFRQD